MLLFIGCFLIVGTRLSLDTIKKRLQIGTNKYTRGATENEEAKVPLFQADIILAIPSIVLQPSLDDIQSSVNKAVQVILKMAQNIPQWEQTILSQKAALKVSRVHSHGQSVIHFTKRP